MSKRYMKADHFSFIVRNAFNRDLLAYGLLQQPQDSRLKGWSSAIHSRRIFVTALYFI